MPGAYRPLRAALAAALLAGGLATSGCGGGSSSDQAIPACQVLTDAEIQAATGTAPSTNGGAGGQGSSQCVWALPTNANGSVTALLFDCGTGCDERFAELAPTSSFRDLTGLDHARISTAKDAPGGAVVERDGHVLQLTVSGLDTDATKALTALATSAAGHL